MHVPAFCDVCGAIFKSGIEVDSAEDKSFIGKTAGRCPVCRVPGRIPDDVFEQVDRLTELLAAPDRSTAELVKLVEVLNDGVEQKLDGDALRERIQAEAENLDGVADLMAATGPNFNTFITMTVALSILVWKTGDQPGGAGRISIEQAVEHIFSETETLLPRLQNRVRRNSPCPCGSGRKHKQCCGVLA